MDKRDFRYIFVHGVKLFEIHFNDVIQLQTNLLYAIENRAFIVLLQGFIK